MPDPDVDDPAGADPEALPEPEPDEQAAAPSTRAHAPAAATSRRTVR
jgi:hypothetical protein